MFQISHHSCPLHGDSDSSYVYRDQTYCQLYIEEVYLEVLVPNPMQLDPLMHQYNIPNYPLGRGTRVPHLYHKNISTLLKYDECTDQCGESTRPCCEVYSLSGAALMQNT